MVFSKQYLPPHDGLLPLWILFISVVSLLNSVQAYYSSHYTRRVYNGTTQVTSRNTGAHSPVTPLCARIFGTWTLIQSLVRMYAAYHISHIAFYQLAFGTFIVAFGHFVSEWLVYRTTRMGLGLAGPIFVSTGTIVWMICQSDYYIG